MVEVKTWYVINARNSCSLSYNFTTSHFPSFFLQLLAQTDADFLHISYRSFYVAASSTYSDSGDQASTSYTNLAHTCQTTYIYIYIYINMLHLILNTQQQKDLHFRFCWSSLFHKLMTHLVNYVVINCSVIFYCTKTLILVLLFCLYYTKSIKKFAYKFGSYNWVIIQIMFLFIFFFSQCT